MTPTIEAEIAAPPPRRTILVVTLAALLAAALILLGGVLPAEFGRDPTGLGRLLGTDALWAPAEQVVAAKSAAGAPSSRSFATPFRSDVVDIPLRASGDPRGGEELEYKVRLPKDGVYVYSWSVAGIDNPEEFYTEFHGHTTVAGKPMTVAFFRKATGTSDNGVLTAPFEGVHGWYFQNQSIKPVVVRLKLSGFYTLIPDGKAGNETGLHAKPVTF